MAATTNRGPNSIRRVLVVLSTLVVALGGLFITSMSTSAASAAIPIGPGYQIPNPYRDSIIGGYIAPDGSVLYCLEWGAESPTGPNDQVLNVSSTSQYAGWSHLEIARVNYIITKWGQTRDNNQAAAVAMAIWMRHPGATDPFFSEHRFVKATIRDATLRANIARHADSMNAEANLFTPQSRAAIGTVTVVPSPDDPFSGEVRISGLPANTRGTILLSGATFDTTGVASAAGVADGDVLRYSSTPTDDMIASYDVRAEATFITPGGPGDELVVWRTPAGFQDLGQSSTIIPDFEFTLAGTANVSLQFSPELSTRAANTQVLAGKPLVDTVAFALADESLEWRQLNDGTYLAVEGWCQAYGPLSEPPETSSTPPVGAPVFGEPVVITAGGSAVDPTTTPIEARVEALPKRAGYYTFVCGIDQDAQTTLSAQSALPVGYAFQHEFGLTAETTVVSAPLANTGASSNQITVFGVAGGGVAVGVALLAVLRWRHRVRS
jgi:hypothetical protein